MSQRRGSGVTSSLLVLTALIIGGSLLLTLGRNTNVQDFDSLTTAFMSTQKLTWYYWGQNRFGNLVPFLAAWIAPIQENLLFQVFLRAVCGFLSIFLVLEILGDRERIVERFAIAIILLTTCTLTTLRFVQPYSQPTSAAVFVLGLWLNRVDAPDTIWRVLRSLAVAVVFWTAFFVNLSLLTLVLPLLGAFWIGGIERLVYRRAFITALVAAVGAYVHSQFFDPKIPIELAFDMQSISAALISSQSDIIWSRLFIGVLIVSCLVGVLAVARQRALPRVLSLPVAHAITLVVAAGNIAFLATTRWVQMNANFMRYYILSIIIFEVTAASWIAAALFATLFPMLPRVVQVFARYALPITALALVAVGAGPPGPIRFTSNEIGDERFAINDDAVFVANFIQPDRPLVAIGENYWLVEPILFVAAQRLNKLIPAHAITAHWAPMYGEVGRLARFAPALTLVCIQIAIEGCSEKLQDVAGLPHDRRSNAIEHEGSLKSGGSFLIVLSTAGER